MLTFPYRWRFAMNALASGSRHTMNPRLSVPFLIATLGVVYGAIGTSPLYALKETFFGHHPLERTPENIFGALSLFFWSLIVVITFKYAFLIMRADNHGEGGIFALLGLLRQQGDTIHPRRVAWVSALLLMGAALLYGDGVITPAISVLSAVEGLSVATPLLESLIVPITIGILIALFILQRKGTEGIGKLFGPVMVLWFLALAVLAVPQIVKNPSVLAALSPLPGMWFLMSHGWQSLFVLGSVVLCVTGGEALYADMGHFGVRTIRIAWLTFVLPSLTLNYFGQGARLLDPTPIAGNNLFYSLVPQPLLFPMIALATLATIIASQALITGSFSLTQQAIVLGVFPRLKIVHTNPQIEGQIYMPFINWSLLAGCVGLVLGFKSSGELAAAYGIAVTGTFAITTAAFYVIARSWGWNRHVIGPVCAVLIGVDLLFFTANMLKFFDGGV